MPISKASNSQSTTFVIMLQFLDPAKAYPLGDPPDYEPTDERTIAALAAADGVDPMAKLYDVMLEHDAQHLLMLPFFNYVDRNHDAIREMLLHPAGVSGLSDGGAHCFLICDASIPTFMSGARSRPVTDPVVPTCAAAIRAINPVPHATSSTRWPGFRSAVRNRSTDTGVAMAGTK